MSPAHPEGCRGSTCGEVKSPVSTELSQHTYQRTFFVFPPKFRKPFILKASLEADGFSLGESCRCCPVSCRVASGSCTDVTELCIRNSCQWKCLLVLESVSDSKSRQMVVNSFDFSLPLPPPPFFVLLNRLLCLFALGWGRLSGPRMSIKMKELRLMGVRTDSVGMFSGANGIDDFLGLCPDPV